MNRGFGFFLLTLALLSARAQTGAFGAEVDRVDVMGRDPAIGRNWGLEGTDSLRAWRITKGDRNLIVAVIDTGIDISHPDLKENIWKNGGETGRDKSGRYKETNGIDDDRNGYIDDVHGWNFAAGTGDVYDRHGHGTHIAGIIGAVGGNGIGLSGVSPRVSLMALKYCEPDGQSGNPVANTAAAFRYAVRMGAHVINYSAGGPFPDPDELAAIREAGAAGVLVVAAAGNERANSDIQRYYPADYDLPNILSATAYDQTRSVLPSSNYGIQTVDLAAPGKDIFSTMPGGRYGYLSGTSQATAFVTGVAALVMVKYNLRRDPARVVAAITQTGDHDARLAGKTKYRSRLNTYRALAIEDSGVSAAGTLSANANSGRGARDLLELARGLERWIPRKDVRGPAGRSTSDSF